MVKIYDVTIAKTLLLLGLATQVVRASIEDVLVSELFFSPERGKPSFYLKLIAPCNFFQVLFSDSAKLSGFEKCIVS